MFEESEWSQIVNRLLKLTRQQTISWSKEALEDGSTNWVEARLGDLEFLIGSVDNDNRPPFYLAVWDATASQYLARLESEPIADDSDRALTAPQKLMELRGLAYRSAEGAPQLLARILSRLDAAEPEDLF